MVLVQWRFNKIMSLKEDFRLKHRKNLYKPFVKLVTNATCYLADLRIAVLSITHQQFLIMKKYYLFAGPVLAAASPAFAQTKIRASGAPNPSSMLEITRGTASNKGRLLPKMTTTQPNAMTSAA